MSWKVLNVWCMASPDLRAFARPFLTCPLAALNRSGSITRVMEWSGRNLWVSVYHWGNVWVSVYHWGNVWLSVYHSGNVRTNIIRQQRAEQGRGWEIVSITRIHLFEHISRHNFSSLIPKGITSWLLLQFIIC